MFFIIKLMVEIFNKKHSVKETTRVCSSIDYGWYKFKKNRTDLCTRTEMNSTFSFQKVIEIS